MDSPSNEHWPVVMPDGFNLHAPGVYLSSFTVPDPNQDATAPARVRASLSGAPNNPVVIGVTHNAQLSTGGLSAIVATTLPSSIKLANAKIWGIYSNGVVSVGIDSQRRYGPVAIGSFSLNQAASVPTSSGIVMVGSGTLQDFGTPDGGTVLTVENITPGTNAYSPALYVSNGKIVLTHAPQIGRALVPDGGTVPPGQPHYSGDIGIEIGQQGSLVLAKANVTGWSEAAVVADTSFGPGGLIAAVADGGEDQVSIVDSNISQNGCYGVQIFAGLASLTGTTVTDNFVGVAQDFSTANSSSNIVEEVAGRIDLSHGGDGGLGSGNRIFCNSLAWRSHNCSPAAPVLAVDLLNRSPNPLSAETVAWNNAAPESWTCAPIVTAADCLSGGGSSDGGTLEVVSATAAVKGQIGAVDVSNPGPAVNAVCP